MKEIMALIFTVLLFVPLLVTSQDTETNSKPDESIKQRHVLVFGGNGMLGSSTVSRLIQDGGYRVTIANRGNWYWDSEKRILPHVQALSCDREKNVSTCANLVALVEDMKNKKERFSAVLDFSAYHPEDITEATILLSKSLVDIYVYISTDSVYDVSEHGGHFDNEGPFYGCKEEEAIRPTDPYLSSLLADQHQYGHKKLQAEERLILQRLNGSNIPYVILRLPDVIGPRDTTYRFWIYQLWIRLSTIITDKPVTMPTFLVNYNNSFVYVEDVSNLIVNKILKNSEEKDIVDQIFNVAWQQNITLQTMLEQIAQELKLNKELNIQSTNQSGSLFLYPSVRRGPIDSTKVTKVLAWAPTDFEEAIKETVQFYEQAMKMDEFVTQRNEIIQVLTGNLYKDNQMELYNELEKFYDINLNNFKPKDEL